MLKLYQVKTQQGTCPTQLVNLVVQQAFAYIFRPLHGIPSTNLAGSFNSIWSNSDTNNLSLVDAAYYDTVESLMLETEFECFEAGTFKGGHGPDTDNKEQKEHVEQMQ